jgi:predicted metalloprotease with PDZ domain
MLHLLLSLLTPDLISYTLRFPSPSNHETQIEARFPAPENAELFLPIWSPGFYRVEDYAAQIHDLSATDSAGKPLAIDHPKPNRWTLHNAPGPITLTYSLHCENAFVTTNWVGDTFALLNGPATFITLVRGQHQPYEITISLPPTWDRIATGLQSTDTTHFTAPDYEHLLDCPIAAGSFDVRTFDCEGSTHEIVSLGDLTDFKPQRLAESLPALAAANHRMWRGLPFNHYVFLLSVRQGGGGLEHANSTVITTGMRAMKDDAHFTGFLSLISHEYFHAFNVKRIRPVELGPFDYETPPRTPSLWISEGLTNYYGDLNMCRAGLVQENGLLQSLSSYISQLQNTPGRLIQSLEDSSLNVWTNSRSGTQTDEKTTVSYYVKGAVAGFLLDARIRHATDGARSLDDLMRLAMQRYSGDHGFTPDQFIAAASETAGTDLHQWYQDTIAKPGELDYTEALDYFGLRFKPDPDGKPTWNLGSREDASAAQQSRLNAWAKGSDIPAEPRP